jgi:hypothetical protein
MAQREVRTHLLVSQSPGTGLSARLAKEPRGVMREVLDPSVRFDVTLPDGDGIMSEFLVATSR